MQARDLNPLAIDGNRRNLGSTRGECRPGTAIAGLLHCNHIAASQQYGCGKAKRRLRPGNHKHLLGLAAYRARGAEVRRDRRSQLGQSGRIAVRHVPGPEMAGVPRHQP
jgi:hypothetical protein